MAEALRIKFEVEGLKPLLKRLEKFPADVQKKVIRNVLTIGSKPALKAIQDATPVGRGLTPDGRSRPHLKDTITKRYKLYKNTGIGVLVMGWDHRKSPHGHLVFGGTKPHRVRGRPVLKFAGVVIRGTVMHPGAKANDWMTPAMIKAIPAVITKTKAQLTKKLNAEAAKMAKKR